MRARKEEKAYLYKVWNDNLKVCEGTVIEVNNDVWMFEIPTENGRTQRCQVSAKEGEVRNNAVWLYKKDDSAAAAAFVRWADEKMKMYEEKLWKLRELSRNMYTMINEAKGKGNQ